MKKQENKTPVIVAIIGAIAVVSAAVITGGFGLLKHEGGPSKQAIGNTPGASNPIILQNTQASNIAINEGNAQKIDISQSTNVTVITAKDINVAPGGVGINQGTINDGGSKK